MNSVFKKLFFTTLATLSLSAEARHNFHLQIVSVDEVLVSQESEYNLVIEEDTFLFNIQGYACALPGIQVPSYAFHSAALEHRELFEFGVKDNNQALIVKKTGNGCSNFPGKPQDIFGEEFVAGSQHKIRVKLERTLVTVKDFDDSLHKVLLETVTSELLGVQLISTAHVSIEKRDQ